MLRTVLRGAPRAPLRVQSPVSCAVGAPRPLALANVPGAAGVARRVRWLSAAPEATSKAAPEAAAAPKEGAGTPVPEVAPAAEGPAAGAGGTTKEGVGGPVSWATLALIIAVGSGVMIYHNIKKEQVKVESMTKVETFGKALLGGPWSLVDSDGRPVTSGDLAGQYYLIYFGFTFCPDICPNELVKMAKVVDGIAATRGLPPVQPVLVTLDPYRDTCAQMGAYAKDFHPGMLALTGTPGQISKVAKAFRVYFAEVDKKEDEEDYLVDHSIVMYLMGPDGSFIDFYTQMMTAPEIIERVGKKIKPVGGTAKASGTLDAILGLFGLKP